MVPFTRFNIVLIGSFDGQTIELNDFDFNGHALVAQLRVPPVLQAKAGEFFVESFPGRFGVGAESPKATETRIEALKKAVLLFASEYAGRRAITGVGLNFTGQSNVRGGVKALLEGLVDTTAIWTPNAGDFVQLSVTTAWDVPDLGRVTVRLEPLVSDVSQLFFDVNVHVGEPGLAGGPVSSTPLNVPLNHAVDRMSAARDTVDAIIQNVLSRAASDAE